MKRLSVVVCTVNRYTFLEQCIKSILANDYNDFELIIVDQSDDNRTKVLVERYQKSDERVKYLFCKKQGLAHARNQGVMNAEGAILAFTDDDCVPQKDWIKNIVEFFSKNAKAVLLFGSLIPVPFDIDKGRIPGGKKKDCVFFDRKGMIKQDGTGGNMAMRKELFEKLRGFDEVATNKYFAAEDWDFAYRTLASGFLVHHSARVKIDHYGFRTWPEAYHVHKKYEMGTAAIFMKHARCGDVVSLWVWLWTFLIKLKLIVKTAFFFKKKNIMSKLYFVIRLYFLYVMWNFIGSILCFTYDVDRKNKVFINHRDKHT